MELGQFASCYARCVPKVDSGALSLYRSGASILGQTSSTLFFGLTFDKLFVAIVIVVVIVIAVCCAMPARCRRVQLMRNMTFNSCWRYSNFYQFVRLPNISALHCQNKGKSLPKQPQQFPLKSGPASEQPKRQQVPGNW